MLPGQKIACTHALGWLKEKVCTFRARVSGLSWESEYEFSDSRLKCEGTVVIFSRLSQIAILEALDQHQNVIGSGCPSRFWMLLYHIEAVPHRLGASGCSVLRFLDFAATFL